MIRLMGIPAQIAIERFARANPPGIYRHKLIQALAIQCGLSPDSRKIFCCCCCCKERSDIINIY